MGAKNAALTGGSVVAAIIVILVVAIAFFLLETWAVMLVLGALALSTGWPIAVSFVSAGWIVILANLLTGGNTIASSRNK